MLMLLRKDKEEKLDVREAAYQWVILMKQLISNSKYKNSRYGDYLKDLTK